MWTKTNLISSCRLLSSLLTYYRPYQLERRAPEDGAHRRALSAGEDVDGVQGSVPRSGAGSGGEEEAES